MEFLAGLHPRVVHFAIGLLFTYCILEVISVFIKNESFPKLTYVFLLLGVLGALASVLTGNQAEEIAEMWEEQGATIPFGLLSEHEDYGTNTMWFFTGLLVIRTFLWIKKKFTRIAKIVFVVLALVGAFLIYETGEHGGRLVFEHGVGTDLIKPDISK